MKGCIAIIFAVLITFSTAAIAEYYVVMGSPYSVAPHHYKYIHHAIKRIKPPILTTTSCQPAKKHIVKKHRWYARKSCYDLDLATGDDDPCVDPNMDIDK